MPEAIRTLIVGDNRLMVDQILRQIRRAGFEPIWAQVDSEEAFVEQIAQSDLHVDIVFVDDSRPSVTVMDLVQVLRECDRVVPLVVVADSMPEARAIEFAQQGVSDYVLTDRISRLASVVVREMGRPRQPASREQVALSVLSQIIEQSPIAIALTDLNSNIVYVNLKFTQLTGYSYSQAMGMPASRLAAGQAGLDLRSRIAEALATEGEWHGQFHNRKKTGEEYWASASISPVRNAQGEATHLLAVYEDITERVWLSDVLRTSEQRFHALVEASPLAIIGLDLAGVIRTWNPAAARIMGWTPDEALGFQYVDLIVPDDARREHEDMRERVVQGERFMNVETRRRNKDGAQFDAAVSTAPLRDGRGRIDGVIVMLADVTQARRLQERLLQSEERFRRLIENSSDLLSILDTETGTILYESPSVGRILGFTPADMVGQQVFAFVHPDDLPQIGQVFSTLIERPRLPVKADARFRRKDGSWAHLEAIGRYAPELGGVVVNSWDITERKRAEDEVRALNADLERRVADRTRELAEANERLQELDRLKSKFVSDVSHDLRAPLANMHLHLDLLERGRPEKRDQYVGVLKAQVNHLIDLVEDILDLSRLERERETARFEWIDLNAVAEQVIAANRLRAQATGLELKFEPEMNLPPVHGVPDQLARLIANLTTNAINYTPQGHVRISTFREDGHVCLRVEDSGLGIDPDDLPHVLDRFYRGRRARKSDVPGTGLGLGIVKEIAALHEGEVHVESRVGKGSTFTVLLPAASEEAGPA